MSINPEGPECVVEVEGNDLRQRKAVIEGFWGGDVVRDDGWCKRWRIGFLHHDEDQKESERCNRKDALAIWTQILSDPDVEILLARTAGVSTLTFKSVVGDSSKSSARRRGASEM